MYQDKLILFVCIALHTIFFQTTTILIFAAFQLSWKSFITAGFTEGNLTLNLFVMEWPSVMQIWRLQYFVDIHCICFVSVLSGLLLSHAETIFCSARDWAAASAGMLRIVHLTSFSSTHHRPMASLSRRIVGVQIKYLRNNCTFARKAFKHYWGQIVGLFCISPFSDTFLRPQQSIKMYWHHSYWY